MSSHLTMRTTIPNLTIISNSGDSTIILSVSFSVVPSLTKEWMMKVIIATIMLIAVIVACGDTTVSSSNGGEKDGEKWFLWGKPTQDDGRCSPSALTFLTCFICVS